MYAKEAAAMEENPLKHIVPLWSSLLIIFCALFLAFSIPRSMHGGPTGAAMTAGSSFASVSYVFGLIGLSALIFLLYYMMKK